MYRAFALAGIVLFGIACFAMGLCIGIDHERENKGGLPDAD
jgi:hypothetical protein